jgi:siroheme synthase (precorrin-2 oxidase/ferrochelatase)
MSENVSTVVLVVGKGTSPRQASEIRRWIRALVPAALILISSAPLQGGAADGVVTVSADDLESGPLAVADALARIRTHRD